jgi:PAS domain S-box-containing protein
MFIESVDSAQCISSHEFYAGYWNWEITADTEQLSSAFRKTITCEAEFPRKSEILINQIFKEDLIAALNLFQKHADSKGKIPYEIKLRYYSKNGSVLYILCKGKIVEWDNADNPLRMVGCNMDITEFAERKIELNKQNEHHKLIIDSINAGIWDWDIATGKEWWSDKFYFLLGYAPGEIEASYNIFLDKLLHPDDRQKLLEAVNEHLTNNTPYLLDIRMKHKDGEYHWYETAGKAKFNETGRAVRMTGSIIDRHERKLFQLELEKNQLLLDEVSQLGKLGIWEAILDSDKGFWSKGMYDIHELPYHFIPTEEHLKQFHSSTEDFNAIMQPFFKCIETGEQYDINTAFTTFTGKRKWMRLIGMPLKDKNNNIIGARGLVQDITDQQNKEKELKKFREELERNQFLLNETGEMAKVGGWDYDLTTGSIRWTKEVYGIHEVPIDVIPDMDLLNSLYSEEARDILHKAINEAVTQKREYDLELLSITFLGHKKWLRAIGKPIIDANGSVVGLRGTVQDINKMKLQDMELRQSASIINNRNQALYNFAHIASHNLRTHAGNIGSILSLMEMSTEPGEKEELIMSLYRISSALNDTIEHLNDVAKIQTEISAARVSMQFSEIFNKIIDVLKPTINETGTSIQADFSEANEIKYIPAYLESIILNLLSNAIKYKHFERKPYITVKSFTKDDKIFLQVNDNGSGIDLAKYKDKLFGMYKTFHAHPDARGIGLFITKNQVEALGGNITVESEPGKGSTFLVQF